VKAIPNRTIPQKELSNDLLDSITAAFANYERDGAKINIDDFEIILSEIGVQADENSIEISFQQLEV
jgi:hypothetical protein